MRKIVTRIIYCNSELGSRNAQFFNRVKGHKKKFNLHEKTRDIKQEEINKWTSQHSKKQLSDKIVREAQFDFDVQQYVKKFNDEHKGKVNMLDFSQYTTKFNDFKNNPISKKDMEVIREFQKRKIDQRLHNLKTSRYGEQKQDLGAEENPLEYSQDVDDDLTAPEKQIQAKFERYPEGAYIRPLFEKKLFNIDDQFVILLLQRNISTKITTLNRITFYRTLLFMGNGNGLISYGKSRALTPEQSLTNAILQLKKNIIAIPLDPACTMPRPIHQKFQDYNVYLRPLPGFNSFGHPVFSTMFALTGIQHGGFVTVHTGKNNYTMLHSLFKAVTKNTTPQDLAELEGFKLYRHRFIRPLTEKPTHNNLSW